MSLGKKEVNNAENDDDDAGDGGAVVCVGRTGKEALPIWVLAFTSFCPDNGLQFCHLFNNLKKFKVIYIYIFFFQAFYFFTRKESWYHPGGKTPGYQIVEHICRRRY